ncbi:MAG: M56 family metallopeptidase [Verrucomicrobiales bacterium]
MMNDLNLPVFLAEFLAKSAIVVALGFTFSAAVRSLAPALKHGLWLRVFAASLAIPLLLLVFPRWEILPSLTETPAPVTEPLAAVDSPMIYTSTFTPEGGVIIPTPPNRLEFSWPWILFSVWGIGVVFWIFRSFAASAFLRKIERSARHPDSGLLEKFTALKQSVGAKQPVTLLISPLVKSPFTWGLTSPRIALPESAGDFPEADIEMILLHELEHVRRRDALAVLISRMFFAMNWVNPLAWLAIRETTSLREEACDRRVLSSGHASESYAEMLFRQAKTASNPYLQTCATAVAETGTIEKRIQMILNNHLQPIREKSSLVSRLCGIAILFAIFVIGISGCSDSESKVSDAKTISDLPGQDSEAIVIIEQKLKEIIVPSVKFSDTLLKDALAFLQQRSVELDVNEPDPAKKGFNIISNVGSIEDARITLHLTNVPIGEALRYTASLAQLKYKVEPNAVVVIPLSTKTSELYTNSYQVPPTFHKSGNSNSETAIEILEEAGITFPPGGSAIYNAKNSQLIVRNTSDQMELVEAFLDSLTPQIPETAVSPEIEAYLKKIESITLPSVEFVDTPIMDAVAFLQSRSVELDTLETDPAKKGINIVVAAGKIRDTRLNLRLVNVPLSEALRYTAELAGGGFKVDESAVVIGYEKSTPRPPKEDSDANAKIAANEKKLALIIIPKIDFHGTPFTDALQFLQQRSVELDTESDPSKKGINVVLNGSADALITLKLANVPLSEALKYTCQLARMEYKVESHKILISPEKKSRAKSEETVADPFAQ